MRKYLIPTIGVIAFVIGGVITRAKAIEGVETLENQLDKWKKSSSEPTE